ncbi:MAG: hypothetical protein ACP5I7_02775 [Sulfolobales archaeon]
MSILLSKDLWGFCRVIETILCVDIGGRKNLFKCSPAGLFNNGNYLFIRIFRDNPIDVFLKLKREAYVFLCRDPLIFLKILVEKNLLDNEDLKELVNKCFLTLAQINSMSVFDDYTIYAVDPLKDLETHHIRPELVPRICRAEGFLIELMIHFTRLELYMRETGDEYLKRIHLIKSLINNLERLGRENREIRDFLEILKRDISIELLRI